MDTLSLRFHGVRIDMGSKQLSIRLEFKEYLGLKIQTKAS